MILNDDQILAAISLRSWARRSFPEVLSAGRGDPWSSFNFSSDSEMSLGKCAIRLKVQKWRRAAVLETDMRKMRSLENFFMGARSVRGCRARVFLNE